MTNPAQLPKKSLWSVDGGKLTLSFHEGQARAWKSQRRFIFVLAGTQGGKTSWGPWWLWREIQRTARKGELNDYLATAGFEETGIVTGTVFALTVLIFRRGIWGTVRLAAERLSARRRRAGAPEPSPDEEPNGQPVRA